MSMPSPIMNGYQEIGVQPIAFHGLSVKNWCRSRKLWPRPGVRIGGIQG